MQNTLAGFLNVVNAASYIDVIIARGSPTPNICAWILKSLDFLLSCCIIMAASYSYALEFIVR